MYQVVLYENINDTIGTILHYPTRSSIKLTTGTIAKGINVVDSFSATLSLNNPGYTKITPLKSLVTVFNTKTQKMELDGYVLDQSGDYDQEGNYSKSITCVSGLNYLKESLQKYGEFRNITPRDFLIKLLNVHNSQVETYKQFKIGTVTVTNSTDNVYRYTDQESNTFDSIFDKLIDRLGGELIARHEPDGWYLDWVTSIGTHKNTELRVGHNIQSASRDEKADGIVTRWYIYGANLEYAKGVVNTFNTLSDGTRVAVIKIENQDNTIPVKATLLPSGVGVGGLIYLIGKAPNYMVSIRLENDDSSFAAVPRLTIGSVNNGKDYIDDPVGIAQFGIKSGHITFDDVFTSNILLTKGINYVNNYKQLTISNVVNALDLGLLGIDTDTFEVGNWHTLNNPGLADKDEVRLIEKRIDINAPQNNSFTIGDKYLTATQFQANNKKNNTLVRQLQSKVNQQIQKIGELTTVNQAINEKYKQIQLSYNQLETTLEIDGNTGTSLALQSMKEAIDNMVISANPVTYSNNGLMISSDKIKLDNLEEYHGATQLNPGLLVPVDKRKLDYINVTGPVDLNDIVVRLLALEQAQLGE